ncbi:MAG: DUF721 domain-containing protein [Gammaproteobacteria bacterium]|nr:DUF721 domain-containing protein [Gammaproteobacteria bacterium]MBU2278793.1 DUF721 domain-containing protein [Gammaproteobacteria bacterium]MBU2425856.1 DUF721 domain-containing protein [Gammaproteobacteria bacterium]
MARYTRKPVDVTALLQQNTLLQSSQQTEIVRQLNTELIRILQLEKPYFCKVSRIQAGRVQILCGSAAWATRLKMQRAAILDNFRQKILPDLAGLDIDLTPNSELSYQQVQNQTTVSVQRQMSEQAGAYLLAAAESADPTLAASLKRLAASASKKTPQS